MGAEHLTELQVRDSTGGCVDLGAFGVSRSSLKRALENALLGNQVHDFSASVDAPVPRRYYGARGHKIILTCAYTLSNGCSGSVRVFVKRHLHRGSTEGWHYQHLGAQEAPIPRLFLTVEDSDREVLFLEVVDTDTRSDAEFITDEARFREFITLVARFNAIHPHPGYLAFLQDKDVGGALGGAVCFWLDRIWRQACIGELGPVLEQWCVAFSDKRRQLQRLATRLANPVRQMDRGLCSNDCYPHCTGRRHTTGERLIFDLEFVSLAPRFRDIARWLGMPEAIGSYCAPRSELSQCYLETYSRGKAQRVHLSQFLKEATLLWASSTFGDLKRGWLAAQKRPATGGNSLLHGLRLLVSAQSEIDALLS